MTGIKINKNIPVIGMFLPIFVTITGIFQRKPVIPDILTGLSALIPQDRVTWL